MYKFLLQISNCNENSVVLDLCCGTGTIGLTFARNCKKLVGFELCPEAIKDAMHNAEMNDIKNAFWYEGKVEDTIKTGIKAHLGEEEVIAIVDPPRAGLAKTVLRCLRRNSEIKKIIYVSCNPSSCARDVAL